MDEHAILKEFSDAEAILHGHFILSSGLRSPTYLQCARVLMDTARAQRLGKALADKVAREIGSEKIDLVVAPAMGGLIIGYEVARQLGKPSIFCERVEGNFTFRRGFEVSKGARVLVVEDVVTTGISSRETFACIEAQGGKVVAECSLVDRSNGEANLGVPYVALLALQVPTYSPDALPASLQSIPAVKPGSRGLKN
jgi:orotate phosphoribosyltransferase